MLQLIHLHVAANQLAKQSNGCSNLLEMEYSQAVISTTGSNQTISVRQKACCVTAIRLSGSRVPSIQWCCATDFRDIFT